MNGENLDFFVSRGNLVILESLYNSSRPMQFKELRELVNPKTNKKFSSSTIAAKLKELEEKGVIQNEIYKDKRKKVLAYSISESGRETFLVLNETEKKLKKINMSDNTVISKI